MGIRNIARRTSEYIDSAAIILIKISLNQVKIYSFILLTFEKNMSLFWEKKVFLMFKQESSKNKGQ